MPEGNVTRKRLKCTECHLVIYEDQIENFGGNDGKQPICPECGGQQFKPVCAEDHACTCFAPFQAGVAFCKVCGESVCPGCGSHDVVTISRVTGYLSDVAGWNAAKRQELKDRRRTNLVGGALT
jgi:hypothetical protein